MAIKLNTGFNIRSNVPIDERFILTFEQMTLINDKLMPEKYFAVSSDDGKLYVYSKSNDFDTKTGRFRLAFENIDAKLDELIAQSTDAIDQVKAETELKISTLSTRVTTVEDKIAKIQLGDIEVGQTIELVTDADYRVTANLINNKGVVISSSTIDLPIESLIKSGTYDRAEKDLVLRSENGREIRIALDDLVASLVTSAELAEVENKIPLRISDLPNDADYITRVESNTNLNNALKNYRSASAQDAIDATLQRKLTAGANIKISKDGVISAAAMAAPENTYYAGDGITISETNVVSATLTEQIVDEKIDSATTETTTYIDSSIAGVNLQVDSKITEVSTKVDSAVTEMTSYVDTTVTEATANIDKIVNESPESCAKLNDVYLDEEIVIPQTIGGIAKDTVYSVNTPVMQIIKDLFAPAPIPTGLKFYYGLSKEIPTSIENLSEVIVDKNTLQTNGFEVDLSPNDDYQVFAIDKELGLRIKSIKVAGFETEFTTIILDEQYLYYAERASDSFTYEIVFKEA